MIRSTLKRQHNRRRPRIERLESRKLLAAQLLFPNTTSDELDNDNGQTSLREAIRAAHAYDDEDDVTINLQAGETYKLRTGGEFGDFEIRRSMTINGNGAVIDGDLATRLFEVHQQPGGIDLVFQNITLREGDGGVTGRNAGGTITFVNSILEDNWDDSDSTAEGAAIDLEGGTLIIDSTILRDNLAEGRRGETAVENGGDGGRTEGGAIYAEDVNLIVRNGSLFEGNKADAGDGGTGDSSGGKGGSALGGAIFVTGASSLHISDSEFVANQALSGRGGNARDDNADADRGGLAEGGAIFLETGVTSLTIEDSVFSGNVAWGARGGHATNADGENRGRAGQGGDARGGAIRTQAATLTVVDTEFSNNEAIGGNGGDSDRGVSGHGGIARGGAIDIRPGTNVVDIQGTIMSGDSDDSLVAGTTYTTLFSANIARGGAGGSKTDTDEGGGDAGHGGIAYGGAIHQDSGVATIDGVILIGNIADGGFGGHGANSASGCGDEMCMGTAGGDNGHAEGGAIKTDNALTLRNSSFIGNVAAGGLPIEGSRVAAGLGGFNTTGRGLLGGRGGDAKGGALRVFEADLSVIDTGFSGNTALGGMGGGGGVGFGLDEPNAHGGEGGRGGDARGGAISATLTDAHEAQLERLLVTSNSTIAGAGGLGGDGAQGGDVDNESDGGRGGHGGDATGGGISLINWSDSVHTLVTIFDAIVSANTLVSGDGGGGGRGGIGEANEFVVGTEDGDTEIYSVAYPGGDGGDGGNGGIAYGGGLFLRSAESLIEGSTIDFNTVSGGFGGRGGAGGSGDIHRTDFAQYDVDRLGTDGGDGGNGGDARLASGGGIAVQGGSADVRRTTIVSNIVVSGSGGVGGDGAPGRSIGGDGGNGGNGGNARGGGIGLIEGGSPSEQEKPLFVTASTIARNTVNAGSAGFGGARGEIADNQIVVGSQEDDLRVNQPLVSQNLERFPFTSTTVLLGAAAGLDPQFNNPDPSSINLRTNDPLVPDTALGDLSDLRNDAAVAGGIALAFGAGVPAGVVVGAALGGVGSVIATGGAISFGTTAATTGAVASSTTLAVTSTSMLVAGAVGVGVGAALFVGVLGAVAIPVIIDVASGDSFHDALASRLSIDPDLLGGGVSFGALYVFGQNNRVYQPPTPIQAGNAGGRGNAGTPRGPGIDGAVGLGRTIVAQNIARVRHLTHEEVVCVGASDPNCTSFAAQLYVNRTVTELTLPDITPGDFDNDGNTVNFGGNLIGILDDASAVSPHFGDVFGSAASPVDPMLDDGFGFFGGFAPTIRLLTGSPALDAVDASKSPFLAINQTSQNGRSTTGVTDIGAWAGDPIVPVIAGPADPVGFAPFSMTIDFGREVLEFTPEDLEIRGGEIQGDITHVEDGLYRFDVLPTEFQITAFIDKNNVITSDLDTNERSNLATASVSSTLDELVPTSTVLALPATADSLTFDVTVSADDPIPDGGLASGISEVDLYVATGDGPFELFETLSGATSPFTFSFTGDNDTQYWFRSVARDLVGNEESKPVVAEASIYLPDLAAPTTTIDSITTSNDSRHLWTLRVRGSDEGGSGLDRVRVDFVAQGGSVTTLGNFDAGVPDPNGMYTVQVPFFPAFTSGLDYYFTTTGIDERGNEEVKPTVSAQDHDISQSNPEFLLALGSEVRAVDVHNGARQRSYIRHVDMRFTPGSGIGTVMNTLADSDLSNDRLVLEKLPAGGSGFAARIDLTGLVTRSGNRIEVDFGEFGLGGDPRSANGNGRYRFTMQLADRTHTFDFHRLLGDANGDGIVDRIDMMDVLAGMRTPHDNADIDGDGVINLVDRGIVLRELGQQIGGGSGGGASGEPLPMAEGEQVAPPVVLPASPSLWQNQSVAEDVNQDGRGSALDDLIVINALNAKTLSNDLGTIAWEDSYQSPTSRLLDAIGDSRVSAFDALTVSNKLNRSGNTATPEPIEVLAQSRLSAIASPDERINTTDHLFAQEGLLF